MKKLLVTFVMIALAVAGYSQATPGKTIRIAARTTTFDSNLPAGTLIYCVADSTLWMVKSAGVASTRTINTAWVASEISLQHTTVDLTRDSDQYNIIIDSTKATENTVTLAAATTTYAGVMTAADKTKLDGITASSGVMQTDNFEVAVSGTGKFETLSSTPKDSTGIRASVNGVELKLTTDFYMGTLSNKKITFKIPVYQYDTVVVTYTK